MAFCSNCGSQISENTKFCNNCGQEINRQNKKSERETVYEGTIKKCPYCGDVLESFAATCPSCGSELRGKEAIDSVKSFYQEIASTQSISQKDDLIRNFPIPNTKEDIVEFMILASSNILGEDDRDIYEAWVSKFEQTYKKAVFMFGDNKDFENIQRIYDNCIENIDADNSRKVKAFTVDTIIRNITTCIGIVILIVAVFLDRTGDNTSLMELAGSVLCIASASSLTKRGADTIDYLVCAISGVLMMWMSFMYSNGSLVKLCSIIVLIIVAVNYFKSLDKSRRK